MFKAHLNYLITITKFFYFYKLSSLNLLRIIPYSVFFNNFYNFNYFTFLIRVMDDILLLKRVQYYASDIDCFVDVGANQGMTSLAFQFINISRRKEILMFEPNQNCAKPLRAICKKNKNIKL